MKKIITLIIVMGSLLITNIQIFGMFLDHQTLSIVGAYAQVVEGDFNKDGYMDFVATGNSETVLFINNKDLTFTKTVLASIGTSNVGGQGLQVIDYNGDGHLDVIFAHFSQGVVLVENNGNNTFKTPQILTSVRSDSVLVVDIDNDGKLEVFVGDRENNRFFVFKQSPSGLISYDGDTIDNPNVHITDAKVRKIYAVDYDLDGNKDILFSTQFNLYLLKNENLATSLSATLIHTFTKEVVGIIEVDLNLDGIDELMFATQINASDSEVFVSYRTNGTFGAIQAYIDVDNSFVKSSGTFSEIRGIRAINLNNDEKSSIVIFNGATNTSTHGVHFFNDYSATINPRATLKRAANQNVTSILIGDFTGNGVQDMITFTGVTSGTSMYRLFRNEGVGYQVSFETNGGNVIPPVFNTGQVYEHALSKLVFNSFGSIQSMHAVKDDQEVIQSVVAFGGYWNGTTSVPTVRVSEFVNRILTPKYDIVFTQNVSLYNLESIKIGNDLFFIAFNSTNNQMIMFDSGTQTSVTNGYPTRTVSNIKVLANLSVGTQSPRQIRSLVDYYYANGKIYIAGVLDGMNQVVELHAYDIATNTTTLLGSLKDSNNANIVFPRPYAVQFGHFDNDDHMDMIVTEKGLTGNIYLLEGTSVSNVFSRKTIASGVGAYENLSLADFNLDGKLDFVGSDNWTNNQPKATVFIQENDGTFSTQELPVRDLSEYTTVLNYRHVYTYDMNQDGYPDIQLMEYQQGAPSLTFYNQGDNTFSGRRFLFSTNRPQLAYNMADIEAGKIHPDDKELTYLFNSDDVSLPTEERYAITYRRPIETSFNDIKPSDPTKLNATFLGWYLDQALTQALPKDYVFNKNTTLYAKWESLRLSITFKDHLNQTIDLIELDAGSSTSGVTLATAPVRPGYTFKAWSETLPSVLNENVVLTAIYEPVVYTISFNSNGGSAVTSIVTGFEQAITKPTDPTKLGFTFVGWYRDEALTQVFTFDTMPLNGATLYAKWDITAFDITYNLNGGTQGGNPLTTYTIETPTYTLLEPTKAGYTFGGWYEAADFTGTPITSIILGSTGNKTLNAKFNPIAYTITYELNEGIQHASNPSSYTVENLPFTLGIPTKEGHEFNGWYDNMDFTGSPITTILANTTGDLDLYAKFTKLSYTVTILEQISDEGLTSLLPGETVVDIDYSYASGIIKTSFGRFFITGKPATSGLYSEFNNNVFYSKPTLATLDFLNQGETIVSIDIDGQSGIMLTSSGRIFTWGYNSYGMLGIGSNDTLLNSQPYPRQDITSRVNSLLQSGETIISVHQRLSLTYMVTSSQRVFYMGYPYPFYSTNLQSNPNVPVVDIRKPAGDIILDAFSAANSFGIMQTNQGFFLKTTFDTFKFQIPSPLPGETIRDVFYIDETFSNSNYDTYYILTSQNRLIQMKRDFIGSWGLYLVKEHTFFKDFIGDRSILFIDANKHEMGMILSDGKVITLNDIVTNPVFKEIDTLELKENESVIKLVYQTLDTTSNFGIVTSLGRAFAFGSNRIVGAGLPVPPQVITTNSTTEFVELFTMTKQLSTQTYEFGSPISIPRQEDKGDFKFIGYFLDQAGTIPFNATTMPAENVVLYPFFKEILTYDLSNVEWIEEQTKVYNGQDYTVVIDASTLPQGVTVLSYEGNVQKNAGTYTITVTFDYDETSYFEPTLTYTFTIEKATFDMTNVSWPTNTFTYNGLEQIAELSNLPEGLTANYTNNQHTTSGTYEASVSFTYDADNYHAPVFNETTYSFVIKKAVYDLSQVVWSIVEPKAYNGTTFSQTIVSGLPVGLTVTYQDNQFIVPGDYKTIVDFTYDDINYETPFLEKDWTIIKATFDLSLVTWTYQTPFVYDGQTKTVTILASSLPQGLTVASYSNHSSSQAGQYIATPVFSFDETLYNLPTLSLNWEILKATFDMSNVRWTEQTEYLYSTFPYTVSLSGLPVEISVTYTNATHSMPGTYVAIANLSYDTLNYNTVSVDNLTWTIIPTYLYQFIVDDVVIFSQREIVGNVVDIPEVSKEGYIFKGFNQEVPEFFGNVDRDFIARFIQVQTTGNTHELDNILNALDLTPYQNDDIVLESQVILEEEVVLDKTIQEENKTVLDTIIPKAFFDFKRISYVQYNLELKIKTNNQQNEVSSLEKPLSVSVTLSELSRNLGNYRIVNRNTQEVIESRFDEETQTIYFELQSLDTFIIVYDRFDILPVLVIVAIILLIAFIILLLLKRRKKETNEEQTPSTKQTTQDDAKKETTLKVKETTLKGFKDRPRYLGEAQVNPGYYLEVTNDFTSTNRIIEVKEDALPLLLSSQNFFIPIDQKEVKQLSILGVSAAQLVKKTPGSKGEKGYYGEVDLENKLTGRTIILVEKLPPTTKKGHRWVRVETRKLKD